MVAEKVKLSFSANQIRIRVVFACSVCLEAEQPPDHIIRRAIGKLESEKRAGSIAYYKTFVQEFRDLWQRIRADLQATPEAEFGEITFTLGSGAPKLDGLIVEAGDSEKTAYLLTIELEPEKIKQARFDFLKLNLEAQLAAIGVNTLGNQAQLFASWVKAARGEKIVKRAITQVPKVVDDAKGYSLISNKSRHEVSLMVRTKELLRDRKAVEAMVEQACVTVEKFSAANQVKMEFLREQLVDRLKSSMRGQEIFGLGLPALYLIGYGTEGLVTPVTLGSGAAKEKSVAKAPPVVKDYPGKGLLQCSIDPDKMCATIESFDVNLYTQKAQLVSLEWIKLELERMGITYNDDDAILEAVKTSIEKGESLDGAVVARGRAAKAPKGPFLKEVFKDSKLKGEDAGGVDIREMQQRSIVKAGALIAEIRYKEEPVIGKDIYGTEMPAPAGEEFTVAVGEGVEQRGTQFFALADGLPKLENNTVLLNKALVHEGDVNLRTGNIRFNGSAEIKGSIDSGATVEVTGDLIVHGTIRDGFVRVGGNLDARSGVVTGKGILRVKGDVVAEFMENSRVICGGNVSVRKAILNCHVLSGGFVKTPDATGVIGGGQISSLKNIETNKLGFPSGAGTKVFAGVNYRAKLSFDIRQARMDRVISASLEDRNALRELARRKDGQKTKKHEQLLQELQARLNRYKPLIEKLKAHLDLASKQITFDPDARIIVRGTLYPSVKVEVAGVVVAVLHEVVEVLISPKRARGSNIQALEPPADKPAA